MSALSTCQWVTRGLMRPIICMARPFLGAETIAAVGFGELPSIGSGASTSVGGAVDPSAEFSAATAAVSACADLPVAVRLRLYALYKQSTAGDAAASPQGSVFDAASQLKWRAWAEVRGMPRDEAMRLYVNVAEAALGGGDSLAVDGLAGLEDAEDAEEEVLKSLEGFAGPVMSIMAPLEQPEPEAEDEAWVLLHSAARAADAQLCRELLNEGHAVDVVDGEGHTALHWAADAGSVDVVTCLLDAGASPEARNCDGSTPLHMAGAGEHLEVFLCLLDHGANPHAADNDGCQPLEFTSESMVRQLKPRLDGSIGTSSS